jgi:tRNA nucleotidyltransferase (CCA-adding enzyme)
MIDLIKWEKLGLHKHVDAWMKEAADMGTSGTEEIQKALALFPFLPQLFAVGGCVRDLVLGKQPHDVDMCTPVVPEEVIRRLKQARYPVNKGTNLRHGTVFTSVNGVQYEITTFRIDKESHGHKADVEFIEVDEANPEQVLQALDLDLSRRDFTVNAMAMGPDLQIRDPFQGQDDLAQGIIRCVGNPMERFQEDMLRIVRAARFAAKLGFTIEPETWAAMQEMAPALIQNIKFEDRAVEGDEIAIERIVMEFDSAFGANKPSVFLRIMQDLGVLPAIIPEFANLESMEQNPEHHPEGNVFNHILEVVDRTPPGDIRWDALLHDVGKGIHYQEVPGQQYFTFHGHEDIGKGTPEEPSIIRQICKRLRMPEKQIRDIESTVSLHMRPLGFTNEGFSDKSLRRFHQSMGIDPEERDRIRQRLMVLHSADDAESGNNPLVERIFAPQALPEQSSGQKSIVQGRDLQARGIKPGPDMGNIIRETQEIFIETGITDVNQLIDMALERMGLDIEDQLA